MLFAGSPESGHTFIVDFLKCTDMVFSQIGLPGREGKWFQSNCITIGFGVPRVGRREG